MALEKIMEALEASEGYHDALKKISLRETDPLTAADSVMDKLEIINSDTKYHC